MKLMKDSNLGKINIEIPIEQGDIILQGSTEYKINRFIIVNDSIYAVNNGSGLWENIDDLILIHEKDNKRYYKHKEV